MEELGNVGSIVVALCYFEDCGFLVISTVVL